MYVAYVTGMVIGMGGSILIAEGGRVMPPSSLLTNPAAHLQPVSDPLYTPFFSGKQMDRWFSE